MADGGLTLRIDEDLAERLRAAARDAGAPDLELFAREALEFAARGVAEPGVDWARADESLAEHDRTGESYSVDEVFVEAFRVIEATRRQIG